MVNSATAAAPALLCGLHGPEDLVALPGKRWIVSSALDTGGPGLSAIDTKRRSAKPIAIRRGPVAPIFDGCAAQADIEHLRTHGLSLTTRGHGLWRLYAVNHGGRESVEAFDLTMVAGKPVATWRGCLLLPDHASGNAVVALPNGRLIVSKDRDPARSDDFQRIFAGKQTGVVYLWAAGRKFREIAGTRLSGDNGLAASSDGRMIFVSETGNKVVHRLPLAGHSPVMSTHLDFRPDNLAWTNDGSLTVTGAYVEPANLRGVHGWAVATLDPRSMKVRTIIKGPGLPGFDGATTALSIGGSIWLGSYHSQCIAQVPR